MNQCCVEDFKIFVAKIPSGFYCSLSLFIIYYLLSLSIQRLLGPHNISGNIGVQVPPLNCPSMDHVRELFNDFMPHTSFRVSKP